MDPVTETTPQPVEAPHRGRGRLELLREIEELKTAKLRLEAEIAELKTAKLRLEAEIAELKTAKLRSKPRSPS